MICKKCKKEFEKRGRRDIFCSKNCYKQSENRHNSIEKYNRKTGHKEMKKEICKDCKEEFRKSYRNKTGVCIKCGNKYRCKVFRKDNTIRAREIIKKYAKSEKGKIKKRLNVQKRIAKKKDIKHLFTTKEWEEKLKMSKGKCTICKRYFGENKLTIDHIIPLCSGIKREYYINDIQPLCMECNSRKGGKIENGFCI